VKYFAYGSNLCANRLRLRKIKSAIPLAIGGLKSYRLCFHKRSIDGSGKCNAFCTGSSNDEVLGVVFEINPDDKMLLDSAEGLGKGYEEKIVSIETQSTPYDCYTYIASEKYIDDKIVPYTWYRDIVEAGAREHQLPEIYIQNNIVSVKAMPDPDADRDAMERRCLEF